MMRGDTRKRRSSPVSKPTLMSVWFKGMNSPSLVCRDLISLARMEASTIWEFRRSPTRNMRHSFSSRMEMTALLENMRVSALFFGWLIFTNMQPTMKALTIEPRMACTRRRMIPSGHFSVMTLKPYPMVVSVSMENRKADTKPLRFSTQGIHSWSPTWSRSPRT
ncbi:rCG22762 [Rattus norvegicus]|uniref:RCG22762 n=1 Tax=Rattus norvegicus TaxID=10116 RepID=A6JYH8_RAT|nr:rCG22762 [Rattus norvegicus]